MKMHWSFWMALVIWPTGLATAPARADFLAITFSTPPTVFTPGLNATRGWEFTTSVPIEITALGLWDQNRDGFATAHQVGVWNTASALLASVTVPVGTSAFLFGPDDFRFVTLTTPLSLAPGTYRIGAAFILDDADRVAFNAGPIGAPGTVTYDGPRLSPGPGFGDPTAISFATGGAFGPNFLIGESGPAIPEPSGLALMIVGSAALLAHRRWNATQRFVSVAGH